MTHVLHVNTFYDPHIRGGAEIMAQIQAELMLERGVQASVLCTGSRKGLEKERINGVNVWRAGIRNLYWHYNGHSRFSLKRKIWHAIDAYNPLVISTVRRLLQQIKPDMIVCHNLMGWSAALWSAVLLEKIPLVQILHDQYLLCVRATMRKKGQNCRNRCLICRMMRMPHRLLSRKLDGVVGVSRFVLDRFREFGYFDGVPIQRVIYNVPRRRAFPSASESGRPSGDLVRFGFIGRLQEGKGIDLVLHEFSRNDFSNAELVVAGDTDSWYGQDLVRRYGDAPRIRFLGYVQPEDFYSQVDVVIVPSLWNDTLPTTVMEAMLYGLPVIGAKRGGIPEMLTDGENGMLFDPDQSDHLANCVKRMVDCPDKRVGMGRASARQSSRFASHERFQDDYASLYEDVLSCRAMGGGTGQ